MSPSHLSVPGAIAALLVVLAAMAAPLYLYRALERRSRRDQRERIAILRATLEAFVAGQASPVALRRVARAAGAQELWNTLETLALTRVERRRLGRMFEPSRLLGVERRALREDTGPRQELAAVRLGLMDAPLSRRALRRALETAPEPVVAMALLGLARAGDSYALRYTLEHPAAVARRTPRYRFALLRAFGPKSLPVLHDAVDHGTLDPQLTRAAIEALGSGRYRAAAASIARRLRDDEPELRVAAAKALGQLEASEHTVSVRRALDDPHWAVRAQAAKALGRMHAHHCEDALAAKLCDSAWWVRRHAAYALADLGEPGQLALAKVVRSSTDRYAREMAREALDHDWGRESA